MKTLFFFAWVLYLVLFHTQSTIAQSDSSYAIVSETPVGVDSLEVTDTTVVTDFCGCESIEKVKACKSCFKSQGPVLKTGYELSFEKGKVMRGSCWSFVNEVYQKSGVEKATVYLTKKSGPYANTSMLQPGDWIYHVNYGYNGVEHSAIFVCWKDKKKKIAITMSYVGQNRPRPGRLDEADLKGVYGIFRAKED